MQHQGKPEGVQTSGLILKKRDLLARAKSEKPPLLTVCTHFSLVWMIKMLKGKVSVAGCQPKKC